MKKKINWLISTIAIFTLMLSGGTIVLAQETDWNEVLPQLTEVNNELVSMEGDGNITLSVGDLFDGEVTLDFRYNIDPAFAGELAGDLSGEVTQFDEEGNPQSFPLDFSAEVTLVDGVIYFFDGSSWVVEDISEMEAQLREEFEAAMSQVGSQMAMTEASAELTQKYFDLSETETEYVMVMKADIHPDEFWADIEEQVDVEQIKEESFEQALEQAEEMAEAQDEEFTDEDREEMRAQFDAAFDVGLSIYFQIIDRLEVRYSKDSYYLTYMGIDINFTEEDIVELAEQLGEVAEVPEEEAINISLQMEFNFSNHGETFDIIEPADAPTFDDTEQMEDDLEFDDDFEEDDVSAE